MPCYHPLTGYRSRAIGPNGKRRIIFPGGGAVDGDLPPVTLPCGQCIGCKLEKSRRWAVRCVHEAQLYEDNAYITLTYNKDHLPANGTLKLPDFQNFMKRLRKKHVPPNPWPKNWPVQRAKWQDKNGIRFFHAGEYGTDKGRPHYHALIFNFDFKDKIKWKLNENGDQLYISEELSSLWSDSRLRPLGFCSTGAVTFASAAYVARYILKKLTGPQQDLYNYHPTTGEELLQPREPEYTTMSRRPGIGSRWLDIYQSDVWPDDFIVMNGAQMRPPPFYDRKLEGSDPQQLAKIKRQRVRDARQYAENNTPERLAVREKVQQAKLKRLKRTI